jgi:glucose/arabinose dehydrogenase
MRGTRSLALVLALPLALLGSAGGAAEPDRTRQGSAGSVVAVAVEAKFNEPWAMTFLPDGRLLVTEKRGSLKLHTPGGASRTVDGVPPVAYGGQGGFGDVILHPRFASNKVVYLSYAEPGDGGRGAAVARAVLDDAAGRLTDVRVIWRQVPKYEGQGHYGHRLAFDAEGRLWVSSSERQQFTPAQDMKSNAGKILRLNEDGTPAAGNPFADQGGVAAQVWSLGHRNVLGLAFDARGRLWAQEMGPRGGDELNLIERGANYGYPEVSNGNHYDGRDIPDHPTRPEFRAPLVTWNPVISPAGLMIYGGNLFADWKGNAFIGGLSSKALVRIALEDRAAREVERFDMGERIREVEQGPDGAIWVLEDERNGTGGRLLKLTPGRVTS